MLPSSCHRNLRRSNLYRLPPSIPHTTFSTRSHRILRHPPSFFLFSFFTDVSSWISKETRYIDLQIRDTGDVGDAGDAGDAGDNDSHVCHNRLFFFSLIRHPYSLPVPISHTSITLRVCFCFLIPPSDSRP